MRRFLCLLALWMPFVSSASEFKNDICSFTFPDNFRVDPLEGGTLFSATDGKSVVAFYHVAVEGKIDHQRCFALKDSQWIPSVAGMKELSSELSDAAYGRVTLYGKPQGGFVRIYRYITPGGVGFLTAESPVDEWCAIDAAADTYKPRVSVWQWLVGGWVFILLGAAGLFALWLIRRCLTSWRFWKKVGIWALIAAPVYAVTCYYFAEYLYYVRMGCLVGLLFVVYLHLDAAGDDDNNNYEPGSGSDGTGSTIDVKF